MNKDLPEAIEAIQPNLKKYRLAGISFLVSQCGVYNNCLVEDASSRLSNE